ncbi:CRISPR-associated endonuclease Cas2 [Gordonia sp. (in: high G+C Gram-positive bacteria)]|uniref:CRISPR-associated endonuclease Cas2 n=1 Tax=Gordonia sp. (in: high G+C Gram-positive bacteria) TaxID=84139 RepID=UPI003527D5DA
MSARLSRLLVAYDIVDDRRRARLARLLSAFGDRIQYSVFLIDLTSAKEVRLRARVVSEIDARVDSVLFCRLGPTASNGTQNITYLGCRREVTDGSDFVL